MAHIHITLIGGQLYPVYLGIAESQPDKVIYVCSSDTEKDARRVHKEFRDKTTEFLLLDPVNVAMIFPKAEKLAEQAARSPNDHYTINISSGTKPWGIAFYKFFNEVPNAEVFYVDQNNHYWGLRPTIDRPISIELDPAVVFRLNGQDVNDYTPFTAYDADDKQAAKEIAALLDKSGKIYGLIDEKNKHYKHQRKGKFVKNGYTLQWDDKAHFVAIETRGENHRWKAPHIMQILFNFGYFEYYVASMLNQWAPAKKILLNVKFGPRDQEKNETDIVINTGARLLFVECKTKIKAVTDIDKFHSVIKNYGGMGCKGVFIQREPLTPKATTKCEDNDIIAFSLKDNHNDVRKLFKILDKQLSVINKK